MSRTGAVLAGAWSAIGDLRSRVTTLESGGGGSVYVKKKPEDYGGKADGISFGGASINVSSKALTVTDPDNPVVFTAADVGKTIVLYGAGLVANQSVHVTTIQAVTDATHVTITDAAQQTISGRRGVYGTDNTNAINQAIAAAVAGCQANKTNVAKVLFSGGMYVCAGPIINNGAAKGKCQIELPAIDPRLQKVVLVLEGPSDPAWVHWQQKMPASNGAVIYSAQNNGTAGNGAAVIGGPTGVNINWGIPGDASIQLSNMLVVIDGITVKTPPNPGLAGVNLQYVAQAHIKSLLCVADSISALNTAPDTHTFNTADFPTNDQGIGLLMPAFGNNDNSHVSTYGVQGFYYGIEPADHFHAERLGILHAEVAIVIVKNNTVADHGMTFGSVSIEASSTMIQCISPGGKIPFVVQSIHTETGGPGTDIIDTNNCLHGVAWIASNDSAHPSVSGAANLAIYDMNQDRGAVTAPAVPATTVALTNPFFRDASVTITAGTSTVAVAIAGQTMGTLPASGVGSFFVPTGKTITLTYTNAPTWKWTAI